MEIKNIKKGLSDQDQDKVEVYTDYLLKLSTDKNKDSSLKNPWMEYRTDNELISFFKRVEKDGLDFDGVHIALISTGISYDYIAYKNKMLLVYPESVIDVALVYKADKFKFEKRSGKVAYTHEINDPFNQDQNNIEGGYCVIKNKRGEFLTLLSKEQIEKHRKVSKTDTIWRLWFIEMCFKTLIKKACKQHFADIFQSIEIVDNDNYDLGQPLDVSVEDKATVEEIKTLEDLESFWSKNKDRNAGVLRDFNKLIAQRKKQIEEAAEKDANKNKSDGDSDGDDDNTQC